MSPLFIATMSEALMDLSEFEFINEVFFAERVEPRQLDRLLSDGWRHFGKQFFRYNVGIFKDELRLVMPMRVALDRFALSKSQKRVKRKNTDLEVRIRDVSVTDEMHELFERHAVRFERGRPESVFSFIDRESSSVPCKTVEVGLYDSGSLAAVSFLDIGERSVSSIYAMFDPEYEKRSLGIMTMLLEIEYAIEAGKEFYYQGYAYSGSSFYDYKKRFTGSEVFDWQGRWVRFERFPM